MCNECKRCDGDLCTYFDNYSARESTIACILFEPLKPTGFDRITASPEVLAEKLVYHGVTSWDDEFYASTICDEIYKTRAEAIAATVAKLKEVEK